MEKTQNSAMVKLDLSWNDIGSWQSIYECEKKDVYGNVTNGDVISIDNENCYISSHSRLVAMVGLKNTMVIETADSILVIDKSKTQDVKKVMTLLQDQKRPEAIRHITEYHSWGTTTILNEGPNFKIHQVDILPGKQLSVHSHQHRNEHWIVLSGIATVLMGDKKLDYKKDESFFISQKMKHSVENNQDTPLSLVEVRSGDLLVETDVERH